MLFIKVLLAGIASIAAVLLLEQYLLRESVPAVVRCDGGEEWIDRVEAEVTR